jgi:hypothetical protein
MYVPFSFQIISDRFLGHGNVLIVEQTGEGLHMPVLAKHFISFTVLITIYYMN